jgi:tRNA threonylcarbamoyladenosine biosynthesis protein TsaB
MTLLALDTATRATTVALCRPGTEPLEARDDPPAGARPRHATHLLALAAALLEQAELGWTAVERIAVGVGPGTFTGLRIGLATARALAQAREIPLLGVSTAASLALGAWPVARVQERDLVVSVIDARRGEVFAAAWALEAAADAAETLADPGRAVLPAQAMSPEALVQWLSAAGRPALAAGDGALAFRSVLERSGVLIPDDGSAVHRVAARHHCAIAGRLRERAPGDVRPEYLRAPDAKPRRALTS